MGIAYLSLGSNRGDRKKNLSKARSLIEERVGRIQSESSLYETQAWGFESDFAFINQVIKVDTRLAAEIVLTETKLIENRLGRIKTNDQYSDRVIDIDILLYDEDVVASKELTIPHPRMHLRRFVLDPLSEIAGSIVHPHLFKTIDLLNQECNDNLKVTALKAE